MHKNKTPLDKIYDSVADVQCMLKGFSLAIDINPNGNKATRDAAKTLESYISQRMMRITDELRNLEKKDNDNG